MDLVKKIDNIYLSKRLLSILRKQIQWFIEDTIKNEDQKKKIKIPLISDQDLAGVCKPEYPICFKNLERLKRKRRNGSVVAIKVHNFDDIIKENYFSGNKDFPHYISLQDLCRRRYKAMMDGVERKETEEQMDSMLIGRQTHICNLRGRDSLAKRIRKRTCTVEPESREAYLEEIKMSQDEDGPVMNRNRLGTIQSRT
jgi:hypothetical protein